MDHSAIRAVSTLGEGHRRRLYEFIRSARQPVSRDEAASAVGISTKLAAFHLDKLTEAGLLRHRFVRRADSGVGRRPKMYEPAEMTFTVSIPARSHDLLAEILVEAVLSEAKHPTAAAAAQHAAHRRGLEVGGAAREKFHPGRLGAERSLTFTGDILAELGFEPGRVGPRCVRLRNCPFHPLAEQAPALVCGLNRAFVSGVIEGLGANTIEAVLEPAAGECCVELRPIPVRAQE
jgi:predicted ArsR family transcriptional regulator